MDAELSALVSSLTIRDLRNRRSLSDIRVKEIAQGVVDSSATVSTSSGIVAYAAEVLASDASTPPLNTENAWTTVYPNVPAGAKRVEVLCEVNSTANADDGYLQVQGIEEIESPKLCKCTAGTDDARSEVVKIINLNASGGFQYKFTNVSGTTIEWALTNMGYSMSV